jgi:hypothetical protein
MYTPTHAGLEFMLQVPMLNILSCQIWLVLEFVISCILFPKSDSTWFHWNICMWCACLLLVLLLFTSLDICFWNSELNCYIVIIHFLSVVCSLLVSSWLTILFCPNWIFFFTSIMKELTITDPNAMFSVSALLVTFQYCTPWFGWA